jgi:hypothetical protein
MREPVHDPGARLGLARPAPDRGGCRRGRRPPPRGNLEVDPLLCSSVCLRTPPAYRIGAMPAPACGRQAVYFRRSRGRQASLLRSASRTSRRDGGGASASAARITSRSRGVSATTSDRSLKRSRARLAAPPTTCPRGNHERPPFSSRTGAHTRAWYPQPLSGLMVVRPVGGTMGWNARGWPTHSRSEPREGASRRRQPRKPGSELPRSSS